jgi:predicted Zn-dependent peptidase
MMPSQELTRLKQEDFITIDTLPNGVTYYLVTNSSMKGIADFALVRKGLCDTTAARMELASLPHFNKTAPIEFLSRKGIGCRKEGYISYTGESTLFRFDNVPVFDRAASDTTLLLLFDLIVEQPYPHAIVIAGDINPGTIQERMKVLSMMVPARIPVTVPDSYTWVPSESVEYAFDSSATHSVTLDFRARRTPREQMNTIQPFISEMFSDELKRIVRGRLEDSFQSRDIPVSALSIDYTGSARTPGDEHFRIAVRTVPGELIPVTLSMASTLSELGANGVELSEFSTARASSIAAFQQPEDNAALVEKCIAAYLYGADLASNQSKTQFLSSRNLSAEIELPLFNTYLGALLNGPRNLAVSWTGSTDEYDDWTFPLAFRSTWNGVSMLQKSMSQWKVSEGDTLGLWSSRNKAKLKNVSPEPVSGGQMWTFANGMRVIYKQFPSVGRFSYGLMVKGGYASVSDLSNGEGAFFSDMLGLYDVAGLSGKNFQRMLEANGIELRAQVSVSDMRLRGSAPVSKFSLLLKALLSLANERKLNTAAFDSYYRRELSRLQPDFLDRLVYPDYAYSEKKDPSGLTPETQRRADRYFSNQFMRMNDGVFVLVGDLPVEAVQKTLSRYLGGFRVSKMTVHRPSLSYKLHQGATTYSLKGSPVRVDIAMASPLPFTTENYMAFKIAGLQVLRALSGTLAESGFSVALSDRFNIYPEESVEMVFTCTPVPEYGLPEGISGGDRDPMRGVAAARGAIETVLSSPIPSADLDACKALLVNDYSTHLSTPDPYVDAVLLRYSNGKDVISNHAARIRSVTADRVLGVFRALSEGLRIEYVVK